MKPMKIPRIKLRKMMGFLLRGDSLKSDITSWATSQDGLGFPLFPRQRLILKLIAGNGELTSDEASDLAGLIRAENPYASVWLPPDWEFDPDRGRIHIPRPPLIALLIAGRRSGKTSIASITLAHRLIQLSRRRRFPGVKLLRGQTVGAINVAADEKQARVLFERTATNLQLAGIVEGNIPASGSMRIGRRVLYESLPTSAGAVRGRTAALCVLDELAHFTGVDGPSSGSKVFDALLPSVRTFGKLGQIIITTSPAGRQGKTWELYEKRGEYDGLLVMQFATWEIHPSITRQMLEPEFAIDPDMASCEYGAQFVAVDSAFLNVESITACVRSTEPVDTLIDPHVPRRIHLDPAFARDRFAIAIGHKDGERVYIDEVIAIEPSPGKPLNPDMIEHRIGQLADRYRIEQVSFDQYCAPYIDNQLKKMGLRTKRLDFTSSSKMAIYTNLRTLIAGGIISFPNDPDLISELTYLRRTLRPGGFSVAAPTSGAVTTDDIADAVAALSYILTEESGYDGSMIYQPGGF